MVGPRRVGAIELSPIDIYMGQYAGDLAVGVTGPPRIFTVLAAKYRTDALHAYVVPPSEPPEFAVEDQWLMLSFDRDGLARAAARAASATPAP